MRITRESLMQAARMAAEQQLRINRRMVCIYLTGSLLTDEPLLGHTTDIDLFFIHDSTPEFPREIIKLSDDIHLDIAHFAQSDFRQPREQRSDPWLAPFICNNPVILHDTQHWFEFTQASICAQYGRPEYTLSRARNLYTKSRQLWFGLKNISSVNHAFRINQYIHSMENAANAIAALTNNPLTERRFLLRFPAVAEEIGNPDLVTPFTKLFTAQIEDFSSIPDEWLVNWEEAFIATSKQEKIPVRLNLIRLDYYKKAILAIKDAHPVEALWPMIKTWTLAVSISSENLLITDQWSSAIEKLGLGTEQIEERIHLLDEYLDLVEETLDNWSNEMGITQD